ncbi:hypothetical protein M441DRAFT_411441 [Trichoderma asperellum CBS 433.97]|uniref:Uncharacterized protein n=1 Tax=Trichoderma asperellum (strain ATCC 204424 / CBS 433.97 / NBRC 101777) TaxID=1042311 RepID=A0A2T3Z7H6_TRIA4|nr:hypothetical protein M441DRAFT_411441 [Trichoderma asperellum CBS 433.97]PTB40748.1 hypothetical protein M441DRAFT_411441 [Trichoderma asperellum CBS 433.97]
MEVLWYSRGGCLCEYFKNCSCLKLKEDLLYFNIPCPLSNYGSACFYVWRYMLLVPKCICFIQALLYLALIIQLIYS